MRLIDADDVLTEKKKTTYYHLKNGDIAIPISEIENAHTVVPTQAIKDCRNCKYGKYNDHFDTYFCYNNEDCNKWNKWESSEEREIKPISYIDCANAMMKMWIDNVVTDGEYNRIMDKLNDWKLNGGENGKGDNQ